MRCYRPAFSKTPSAVRVRARQGTTAAFYIRTMDLNGDGRMNALDLTAVRRNLNQSLPASATSLLR